jgi:hypothetical protein
MTLPPRILVHVGQAKTGSTALQNFLDRQHDALVAQGVLFPRSVLRRSNPNDPARTPGHLDLLGQLRRGERSPLEDELAAHAGRIDTLVLSIENIFHYPASARPLGRWLKGRQVEMLAVLRDPVSWAQALHYEQVMGGINCATRPLERLVEDGLDSGIYAYDTMLDRLADMLGAGTVHVLDYARHRDGSALIDAALALIRPGLTLEDETRTARVNRSVHVPEAIEAVRRLNPLVARLPQAARFDFAHAMRTHVETERAAGHLADAALWLREPVRGQLARLAAAQNRLLARRMPDGLAPDLPADLAHGTPAEPDPARTAALHGAGLEMLARLWAATPPGERQGDEAADLLPFDLTAEELRLVLQGAAGPGAILLGRADLLAVLLAGVPGRLVQAPEADADRRLRICAHLDALALPSGVLVWRGLRPGGLPLRTPGLVVVAPGTPEDARAAVLDRVARSPRALRLLLADPQGCEAGRALAAQGRLAGQSGRLADLRLPRLAPGRETAD